MPARCKHRFFPREGQVTRANRRRLMSSMKQAELRSREDAVGNVRDFFTGLLERDWERCKLLQMKGANVARNGDIVGNRNGNVSR